MKLRQRSALHVVAVALIALAGHPALHAHDVPDEIVLQSYVKPEGNRLQVLLRIPLIAIADANLPKDGPGYLAMRHLDPALREVANQISNGIVFLEENERLGEYALAAARISLPSDRSFASYDSAVRHIRGPKLPDDTQIYYNQGFFDLELHLPIRSEDSRFSMRVLFGRGLASRTASYITFVRPDGAVREFRIHDDASLVHLDPKLHEAMWVFLRAGFYRFLNAVDSLLFVVLLAIPYRRARDAMAPIAAFVVAHSITLAVAAFRTAPVDGWFPPAIGAIVALSIVYVAIENAIAVTASRERTRRLGQRAIVAFVFGLAHGFGFASALGETLQFAGSHPWAAVAAFNVGLELGVLIILAIVIPAFNLLFSDIVRERGGTIVASVLAGHVGWHWMTERFAIAQLNWTGFDLNLLLLIVRWLLMLTIAGGVVWFLRDLIRKKPAAEDGPERSIVDGP